MRKVLATVIGLVLAVSLAGCVGVDFGNQNATVQVSKSQVVSGTGAEKIVAIPNGVVATSTLVSGDGKTTGTVIVRKGDKGFVIELADFRTPNRNAESLALADSDVQGARCGDNLYQSAYGDPIDLPFSQPLVYDGAGDPTFLRTVMVLKYPTGGPVTGCIQPILASATLKWTAPDTHPDLIINDSGTRPGATGTVATKDGVPWSYRTAQRDTWSSIATRFGVTPDDLTYLNPIRLGNSAQNMAYADQLLNLSKANRGNSESRRAGH